MGVTNDVVKLKKIEYTFFAKNRIERYEGREKKRYRRIVKMMQ